MEDDKEYKQPHEKIKLTEVNSHLTCHLCKGYYIDATTIVECLHSFCRSCIIRYLQLNSYCPVCEVMINTAKPNIKPDKTLQDIVYKLVPGLYASEMSRRRQFYKEHPDHAALVTPEQRGACTERIIFSPQDAISLSIEYTTDDQPEWYRNRPGASEVPMRRYLQCPAMLRVEHLKKFICNKYNVDSQAFHVDILYKRVPLPDHYTLMDIAYIYSWKRNEPMKFFFRITDIQLVSERFDYFEPSALAEDEIEFKPHTRTPGKKQNTKQSKPLESAKVSSELTKCDNPTNNNNSDINWNGDLKSDIPNNLPPNGLKLSPNCTQELTIKTTNLTNIIGPNPKTNSALTSLQQQKGYVPTLLKATPMKKSPKSPKQKSKTETKPFENILKTEPKKLPKESLAKTLKSIHETIKNFPRSDTPPMFMENRLKPIDPPSTENTVDNTPIKPECRLADLKTLQNGQKFDTTENGGLTSPNSMKLPENTKLSNTIESQIPPTESEVKSPGIKSPITGMNSPGIKSPLAGMKSPLAGMKSPLAGMKSPLPGMKSPIPDIKLPQIPNHLPILPQEIKKTEEIKIPIPAMKNQVLGMKTPGAGLKNVGLGRKSPASGLKSPVIGRKTPTSEMKSPGLGRKTPTLDIKCSGKKSPGLGLKSSGLGMTSPGAGIKTLEIPTPTIGMTTPISGISPVVGIKNSSSVTNTPVSSVKGPGTGTKNQSQTKNPLAKTKNSSPQIKGTKTPKMETDSQLSATKPEIVDGKSKPETQGVKPEMKSQISGTNSLNLEGNLKPEDGVQNSGASSNSGINSTISPNSGIKQISGANLSNSGVNPENASTNSGVVPVNSGTNPSSEGAIQSSEGILLSNGINNQNKDIKHQESKPNTEDTKVKTLETNLQKGVNLQSPKSLPNIQNGVKSNVSSPGQQNGQNILESPKVSTDLKIPLEIDGEKQEFLNSIQLTAKTIMPIINQATNPPKQGTKRKYVRKEKPAKKIKLSPPKPKALAPKIGKDGICNQVVRQIMTNVKQQVSNVTKLVGQTDKIPPTNNQLQSLFDNCKINIPSSLSITLTESPRSDDGTGYESKPTPIKPVQNYIEILKLPDAQPEESKEKTVEKSKPDGTNKKQQLTFQTMFEEAVKRNETMKTQIFNMQKTPETKKTASTPKTSPAKPKKNQNNALDLSKTSPKEGTNKRTMSVEQIAHQLSKKSRMEAENPTKSPVKTETPQETDAKKINIVNNNFSSGGSLSIQENSTANKLPIPRLPVAKAPTLKLGPSTPRAMPKPSPKPVVPKVPKSPKSTENTQNIQNISNIMVNPLFNQAQLAFQQALMMSHQLELQRLQATQQKHWLANPNVIAHFDNYVQSLKNQQNQLCGNINKN